MIPDDIQLHARPVAHLPLVREIVERIGILDVIDDRCPRHALNRISDAQCVLALITNVLAGRPALYRMDQWLAKLDVEVLFGEGAEADAFHDTRLGVALDHLDEAGTDNILHDLAVRYLLDHPGDFSAHHDTTSVSLQGVYDVGDAEPTPARGFSKDHRPDLLQLVYGLTLHGAASAPLLMSVDAGNTSDSTVARDHLARLVELLPDERNVTFVGDCKLVDKTTVGRLLRAGLHFVSLVPNSFNIRGELIEQAWAKVPSLSDWPVLGTKPGRRKDDPDLAYRGMSFEAPFRAILEDSAGDGPDSVEQLRFVVVASDVLAAKFDRDLDKKLEREVADLDKRVRSANRNGFACEADTLKAARAVVAKARLHDARVQVTSEDRRKKRNKRGRPANHEVIEYETVWHFELSLEPDQEAIVRARQRASCFVLVTDWGEEEWDDRKVLAEYRHQHSIEGHTGFRWLKGPAAVAPVFLKTPGRIRAMGLVLVLALMVRNYIQGTLRSELAERGETLPHPFTRKEERSLTPEMAFEHFGGLMGQIVTMGEHRRRMPVQPSEVALRILALFDLHAGIFDPPRGQRWKWQGDGGGTSEM